MFEPETHAAVLVPEHVVHVTWLLFFMGQLGEL